MALAAFALEDPDHPSSARVHHPADDLWPTAAFTCKRCRIGFRCLFIFDRVHKQSAHLFQLRGSDLLFGMEPISEAVR